MDSVNGRYLADARLPSNSGYKSVQIRLREVCEGREDSDLLVEVAMKGEMFERGTPSGALVTDFEWVFPQVLISSKALNELHASVRRSLDALEPFEVHLGGIDCELDFELSHRPDVSRRRDLTTCTVACSVGRQRAECAFVVDPSCLLELAEGLEHMAALVNSR